MNIVKKSAAAIAGTALATGIALTAAPAHAASTAAQPSGPSVSATAGGSSANVSANTSLGDILAKLKAALQKKRPLGQNIDIVLTQLANAGVPVDPQLVQDMQKAVGAQGVSSETMVLVAHKFFVAFEKYAPQAAQLETAFDEVLQQLTAGGVTNPDDLAVEIERAIKAHLGVKTPTPGIDTFAANIDKNLTVPMGQAFVQLFN